MKISAMNWSKSDPNLVVSADESGSIVFWNLFSNTTHHVTFGKLVPTCLACCPHRQDLVAVGTRCGLVCTVNFKGKLTFWHTFTFYSCEILPYFEENI